MAKDDRGVPLLAHKEAARRFVFDRAKYEKAEQARKDAGRPGRVEKRQELRKLFATTNWNTILQGKKTQWCQLDPERYRAASATERKKRLKAKRKRTIARGKERKQKRSGSLQEKEYEKYH
jgi:hypothetical protein